MKTLYLDLLSGISGDMFLGALLDLGIELGKIERELRKLNLAGYHLHATRAHRGAIAGMKFDVHTHDHSPGQKHSHEAVIRDPEDHQDNHHHHHHDHDHDHVHDDHHHHDDDDHHHEEHGHHEQGAEPHPVEDIDEAGRGRSHHHLTPHRQKGQRDFAVISRLISESSLSDWVKEKALAIFRRIAVAEGKIHGMPPESVHFHEVGGVDSIVDIVGGCIGLEMLGKPRVVASLVVEGTGWVECAHGRFPVPAAATLEILGARGIPLTQCEEPHELVTPTGAALLAEFAQQFGPMENLIATKVGYGLGSRENKTRPNVLRAILGTATEAGSPSSRAHDWETDTIFTIETNLDDCPAEVVGHFMEKAFQLGALEVFYTSIQMKKNRPGVLLTALCPKEKLDRLCELVLNETSAFGLRFFPADRRKLHREWTTCATPLGEVDVKIGKLDGQILQIAPEYESCRRLSEKHGVPIRRIYDLVYKEFGKKL